MVLNNNEKGTEAGKNPGETAQKTDFFSVFTQLITFFLLINLPLLSKQENRTGLLCFQ